ncbi:heat shock protein 90-6, mitochondrial-like [Rutidosis leptorrhynchoides]|uniref:heat shock protein 90-6, mitochondrial-like n=1 Tax=Rutidosis leptorrhynchoides TaxID=125765 RepID=UPI003A9A12EA
MHRLSRRSVNSILHYGTHRRRAVASVSVYSLTINEMGGGEKNCDDVRWHSTTAKCSKTLKLGRMMIPSWNRYESTGSKFQTTESTVVVPVEKYEYEAEVSRLMDHVANRVYSNKELFLRELISNASDALDKLRFLSVTEPQILEGAPELDIRIQTDQDNGIITLTDSGIGMTHDELVDSLGTIAHNGTAAKFLEALNDSKDAAAGSDSNLIGQFGLGFYSAFLVADKVVVSTKSPKSDKQYVWEGEANSNSYVVREETDPDKFIPRGTSIKLHLKRDDKGFAHPDIINRLIKIHSQVVSFPIYTWQEKGYTKHVILNLLIKRRSKKIVNESQPIWLRNPKEVTREEYNEFYKKAFSENFEPLASSHFTTTEDEVELRSILYLPAMEEYFFDDIETNNIRLYEKNLFISSDFDREMLPDYIRFVKGVVDSNDFPLILLREIFQESPIVRIMRKRLAHQALDMILLLSKGENRKDYEKFWKKFGVFLMLGCIEDGENHKRLAPLLRFNFSNNSKAVETMMSLDEYVENMKPGQEDIYYMSVVNALSGVFVPFILENDFQVLLVVDTIDEVALTNLKSYKGKNFVDVKKVAKKIVPSRADLS